jgi:hypothetical protein
MLYDNSTSSHPIAKQEEQFKENAEFCLEVSLSYFYNSLTCRKILQHGAEGFTSPLKEVHAMDFYPPKNPIILGWA